MNFLADGILEFFSEVSFEHVLVAHASAVQGLGPEQYGLLDWRLILRLSEPHNLCIYFSDPVIGRVGFL